MVFGAVRYGGRGRSGGGPYGRQFGVLVVHGLFRKGRAVRPLEEGPVRPQGVRRSGQKRVGVGSRVGDGRHRLGVGGDWRGDGLRGWVYGVGRGSRGSRRCVDGRWGY